MFARWRPETPLMFIWSLLISFYANEWTFPARVYCQTSVFKFQIPEERAAGFYVGSLASLGSSPYQLIPGHNNRNKGFYLDRITGNITTTQKFDRERSNETSFQLSGLAGLSILFRVDIFVTDINDFTPEFSTSFLEKNIIESVPVGYRIDLPLAEDKDLGSNGTVSYQLVSENKEYFGLVYKLDDTPSLDLVVNKTLDRETTPYIVLNISACDHGTPYSLCGFMKINITLNDANDNSPVFNPTTYIGNVSESAPPGTSILQVFATDLDSGSFGAVTYDIDRTIKSDFERKFSIGNRDGIIKSNGALDYEAKKIYSIILIAKDSAPMGQRKSNVAYATIHVLDVNDNPPEIQVTYFSPGSSQVQEKSALGTSVARIAVRDRDSGLNGKVDVLLQRNSYLSLTRDTNSTAYVIRVIREIDRELTPQLTVTVMATDQGQPPKTSTQTLNVIVGDVNDNIPHFLSTPYRTSVNESSLPGTSVYQVQATDMDLGSNAEISFSILPLGVYYSWFRIDSRSGIIFVNKELDRELTSNVTLTVKAEDHGTPRLKSSMTVSVDILDSNDNIPIFTESEYKFVAVENSTAISDIGQVHAIDTDLGIFKDITYSVENTTFFSIDKLTGVIKTTAVLDREVLSIHSFLAIATDGGGKRGTSHVSVQVLDINDNSPYFHPQYYNFSVHENTPVGLPIGFVFGKDNDFGENQTVLYKLRQCNPCGTFIIHSKTGGIIPNRTLDLNRDKYYRLEISGQDLKGLPATNFAIVDIHVLEPLNAPPKFEHEIYNFTIVENNQIGAFVGKILAKRENFGIGQMFTYYVLSGDSNSIFSINASGVIITRQVLDYERVKMFELHVQAISINTHMDANTTVKIIVVDQNDNSPRFSKTYQPVSVNEGIPLGFTIYKAVATDEDTGPNGDIIYSLVNTSGPFSLNQNTGELSSNGVIDYETQKSFNVYINASDQGLPQRSVTLHLYVSVVDLNDNSPKFSASAYSAHVAENVDIGFKFITINVTDVDTGNNGHFTLSFQGSKSTSHFKIHPDGQVSVVQKLDRERQNEYFLRIFAKDDGIPPRKTYASLTVIIVDINDNKPVFQHPSGLFYVREEQSMHTTVGTIIAKDSDFEDNGLVTYKFNTLSNHFIINRYTGVIKTKVRLNYETMRRLFNLIVIASDQGSPPQLSRMEIKIHLQDINDNPPMFHQQLPFTKSIPENTVVGTSVLKIIASDQDSSTNGKIHYRILQMFAGEDTSKFTIDSATGVISTINTFNLGKKNTFMFTVTAEDQGVPQLLSVQKVIISILPSNFQPTLFPVAVQDFFVPESIPVNSSVTTVQVRPNFKGGGRFWDYRIESGDTGNRFKINRRTGTITVGLPLVFSGAMWIQLKVSATDLQGIESQRGIIYVNIKIIKANQNWPVFPDNPVILAIRENVQIRKAVHRLSATDLDNQENGKLVYSIKSQGPGAPIFNINPFSGEIYTTGEVDRESVSQWTLKVTAADLALNLSARYSSTATVKLIVIDENDNRPEIISSNYTYMMEDEAVGYPVTTVLATDADDGPNAKIAYKIVSGNENGTFRLHASTGIMTLENQINYRMRDKYLLYVVAQDQGTVVMLTSKPMALEIEIIDVNNERPTFTDKVYTANIYENVSLSTQVIQVKAIDLDSGTNGEVFYAMPGNEKFDIDPKTGWISVREEIDREQWNKYVLHISAQDNAYPFYSDTASVVINVLDVNDCHPEFKDGKSINLSVVEHSQNQHVTIHRFVASDCDVGINAVIKYQIIRGDTSKFSLNLNTGQLKTKVALDREEQGMYELEIEAKNIVPQYLFASQKVKVWVEDVNDENPTFTVASYSKRLPENTTIKSTVLIVKAVDKDSGVNGKVIYSLPGNKSDGKFDINPVTGAICLISPLDYEARQIYRFSVMASDQALTHRRNSTVEVVIHVEDINDNMPTFSKPVFEGNLTSHVRTLKILATDNDSGQNGEIRYTIKPLSSQFTIGHQTGFISVQGNPAAGRYNLHVKAYDLGTPQLSNYATVIISIGQLKPEIPYFLNTSVSFKIPEGSHRGFRLGKMVAQMNPPAPLTYSIIADSNPGSAFKIHPVTGVLSVETPKELDYEKQRTFKLGVHASVSQNDSLSTYTIVEVNLMDVNDNPPIISPRNLDHSLEENQRHRQMYIYQFHATDADSGENGRVTFAIVSGNENKDFLIHPRHGILITLKRLDHEKQKVYKLKIKAMDNGAKPKSSYAILTLNVIDKNDNPPYLPVYSPVVVSERKSVGEFIKVIVKATDPDESSTITYNVSRRSDGFGIFEIEPNQGTIKLLQDLDYEKKKSYVLLVQASDGLHTVNTSIFIKVKDENDNQPEFSQTPYYAYLPENLQSNFVVVTVNATDKDSGDYGKVQYSFATPADAFVINQETGVIKTTKSLPLDPTQPPVKLIVKASDLGSPPFINTVTVWLRVKTPNYKGPRFEKSLYTGTLFENTELTATVKYVEAVSTVFSVQYKYSIISGNEDHCFDIDSRRGRIFLSKHLDREKIDRYELIIEAKDKESPPNNASTKVIITVADWNDNYPTFSKPKYGITVLENVPLDTTLIRVMATDADDPKVNGNAKINYNIDSGNDHVWFQINSEGYIKVNRLLDRESVAVHRLTVRASDEGTPKLSNLTSVVITLLDVNDNTPEFRMVSIHELEIKESSRKGTSVFKAIAVDKDEGNNGLLTYSIVGGDGREVFRIDNETGWVFTKADLDYERKSLYKLLIRAVDHGKPPRNGTFEYRVAVEDVDEFPPVFLNKSYDFEVRGDAKIGQVIGKVHAVDKDGGKMGIVKYSFHKPRSNYLRIHPDTGQIIVNADLRKQVSKRRRRRAADEGNMYYLVQANNGGNTTMSQLVPLSVTIDYSCEGCKYVPQKPPTSSGLKGPYLILVIVFGVVCGALVLGFIIFVVAMRKRRKQIEDNRNGVDPSEAYVMKTKNEEFQPPECQPLKPGCFDSFHPKVFTTTQSIGTSSGRGSSESQLLSESHPPSVSVTDNGSTHSFVVYHDKPVLDSGIAPDLDNLSNVTLSDITPTIEIPYMNKPEVASSIGSSFGRKNEASSIGGSSFGRKSETGSSFGRKTRKGIGSSTQSESHESLNDFMDEGGGEAAGRMDVSNLLYAKLAEVDADEQEAIMDGTRPFSEEGIPSRGGSLSTIIGSEDELRGSYNWDYLLDWGPQFKPLATVFSEIAKMKDPTSRKPSIKSRGPPPVGSEKIDSIGPVSAGDARQSNLISNRTSLLSSLSSFPRSPMSGQSSYTSAPLSPNFTPAITPLITRSPSVSPLGTPDSLITPGSSKPGSLLDIAERAKRKKDEDRSQTTESSRLTLSNHTSEHEVEV